MRTLERKIGAICRAVAVRVAETRSRPKTEQNEDIKKSEDDEDDVIDHGTELVDKASLVATAESAISHPPDMPIVIDQHAVKDILGVKLPAVFMYITHIGMYTCNMPA